MNLELYATMLAAALRMMDLPEDTQIGPVEIKEVPHATMCEVFRRQKDCMYFGAYFVEEKKIIYSERINANDPTVRDSILFHEIVHHVQAETSRHKGTGCEIWVANEREAYQMQQRYLYEHGSWMRQMIPTFPNCPKDEGAKQ